VVASYRGEEAPRLAERVPDAMHLCLAPLPREYVAELADSMVGAAKPHVVDFLDRHSEGNLFFLVEIVRALAEGPGGLDGIGKVPLPEGIVARGIETIVARRLAKIPDALHDALAFAAVAGRALDRAVLEARFPRALVAEMLERGTEVAVL